MRMTLFTVEGRGEFPWDMLRYDECWPRGSQDVSGLITERPRRPILLCTYKPSGPTVARWESFGWTVTAID